MASKGRMGIQVTCARITHGFTESCFNGQQRPDGDSGLQADAATNARLARFNGQQRPDGDSGGALRKARPRGIVSMASKGRMGIQEQDSVMIDGVGPTFQWPAKAGWGFSVGGADVSMASKGRMGIQGLVYSLTGSLSLVVSMASKGRMGIQG